MPPYAGGTRTAKGPAGRLVGGLGHFHRQRRPCAGLARSTFTRHATGAAAAAGAALPAGSSVLMVVAMATGIFLKPQLPGEAF
jgi:hypothetical protein